MYPHLAHVFIDGGYLRALAKDLHGKLIDPRRLAMLLCDHRQIQSWAQNRYQGTGTLLGRINYYDALPDQRPASAATESYWKAIELEDDVHLGFGALRGLQRKMRQKGVDTLLAVDMLVGAFSSLFDVAILLAGDADFVPVVEEVRRRGVMVVIAGVNASVSDDLRRVADRFIDIPVNEDWLHPMAGDFLA
jgi:uncharacterized LabA/DUF88 family protein